MNLQAALLSWITGAATRSGRRAWIAGRARELRKSVCRADEPVALGALCELLQIHVISTHDSENAHLVFCHPRPSTILLPASMPPAAQKIAIAHELGHAVLQYEAIYAIPDAAHRQRLLAAGASREEEDLCDDFAFELLVPHHEAARWADGVGHSPFHLADKLAHLYDTSSLLAAYRLAKASANLVLFAFQATQRSMRMRQLRLQWAAIPSALPYHIPSALLEFRAEHPTCRVLDTRCDELSETADWSVLDWDDRSLHTWVRRHDDIAITFVQIPQQRAVKKPKFDRSKRRNED